MITGASQADVALLMVPADGNFTAAIAKGDHKSAEVQGQTRQHAILINLLGVKQLVVGVNKMDTPVAAYSQARFVEVRDEMARMLTRIGWKREFVANSVPIIPISGWEGDNLVNKSTKMAWWEGVTAEATNGTKIHCFTLLDVLENFVTVPERPTNKPIRLPVSSIFQIRGIGDVIAGRVEQGSVRPGDVVIFIPTHTPSNPCQGKIFSIEMHHHSVDQADAGDNIGINIRGLPKDNMPRSGDIMILRDDSLTCASKLVAQVQVLSHPGELKPGYTPIAYVRTARSAIKLTEISWKIGKETGGNKVENPVSLKEGDVAQVVFEPQSPFVVEMFQKCEGLGRVAVMEGNSVVMLGKIIGVEMKSAT